MRTKNIETFLYEAVERKALHGWQADLIMRAIPGENAVTPCHVFALDGDILAYRTAAVCEEEFEGSCYAIMKAGLKDIVEQTGISLFRIYLSGDNNFRYDLAKTKPYKGNRDSFVRPRFLEACKEHLIKEYGAIRVHGAEADDGIASDMIQNGAYHCGIDKDILQVPGRHYNWVTKEWTEISEDEAIVRLWRQVLMGDASDNIPGLPRVGEKTAEKYIPRAETAEDDAIAAYKEVCRAKLPEVEPIAYMAEMLNLVRMKTDLDLDLSKTLYFEPDTAGFADVDVSQFDKAEVAGL